VAPPAATAFTPTGSTGQYGYTPERIPSQASYAASQPSGDPDVANRAAIWLALTLPFIGLPAGWLFMMVEDQKKQRVGRICVMWSMFALIFHLVFTLVLLKSATAGLVNSLMPIVNSMAQKQQNGAGAGSGLPGE
jgi:hypothetical protein